MSIDTRRFKFVARLVADRIAHTLSPAKRYLVAGRVGSAARAAGYDSAEALIEAARDAPGGDAEELVIDAMTTNETLFFRDIHPFRALAEELLPKLIAARPANHTLRVWSAACSTGQEPYSLALMIAQHLPRLQRERRVEIFATDISRGALARARRALYTELEIGRGLPRALRDRFFHKVHNRWQLDPSVRGMVRFSRRNLATDPPPTRGLDLVLIRNVLIYFGDSTRRAVLAKIAAAMHPAGILLLGSSENPRTHSDRFTVRRAGRTHYFVRRDGPLAPATTRHLPPPPHEEHSHDADPGRR